jgi:hypothetical protein
LLLKENEAALGSLNIEEWPEIGPEGLLPVSFRRQALKFCLVRSTFLHKTPVVNHSAI